MPVMSLPDLTVDMHRAPICTRSSFEGIGADRVHLSMLQIWGTI